MIAAAGLASTFVTPALGDITIQTAKIAKGVLMIGGVVPPHTPKVMLTISPGTDVEVAPPTSGAARSFPPPVRSRSTLEMRRRPSWLRDARAAQIEWPRRNHRYLPGEKDLLDGSRSPGQLPPAQPPPLRPPLCEVSCNPNDFFLSSACGEGEILGRRIIPPDSSVTPSPRPSSCGHR